MVKSLLTTSALFKIWSYDEYGNYGENTASNYFSINAENTQISDSTLLLIGVSDLSTLDFVPPIIDLTYPENNEIFTSGDEISIEWTSIEKILNIFC